MDVLVDVDVDVLVDVNVDVLVDEDNVEVRVVVSVISVEGTVDVEGGSIVVAPSPKMLTR